MNKQNNHNHRFVSRIIISSLLVIGLLAMAGCRAPATTQSTPAPAPASTSAPPASAAIESAAIESTAIESATIEIDRSCQTSADCTVKNVGNCCGYYPACVNVDSPTDPEGVKAQCAESGMASVCGFPNISSCQCVAGKCEGSNQLLSD